MATFIDLLKEKIKESLEELYQRKDIEASIQIQKTRKEFSGDITLIVFPLLKFSKKSPEEAGDEIGQFLIKNHKELKNYNVIKGFLNIELQEEFWVELLNHRYKFGFPEMTEEPVKIYVVEYSSPNTNKPLHLGHIRNNLIGFSLSRILEATGHKVFKVNIVNDRGIHICKSMLARMKWGGNETPENTGKKGDHLVGDYYVKFEQEYKKEMEVLKKKGLSEDQAMKQAPLIQEAQELLRKWENHDKATRELWEKMNTWVYEGFDSTYQALGVDFDKIYYESETYEYGRRLVREGLKKNIFTKREDDSVWVNLESEGLDEKLLLRSDGTSVYITQDLGTAHLRFRDYHFNKHIYVVGNEQDYHFRVLKIILKKMGVPWAEDLYHLSYGMVELPYGKMKSREGTVIDADDLIEEMIRTAGTMSAELGKLDECDDDEKENVFRIIGLGALKYFILRVDPKKNMLFDPAESIDFNGNTGPFVQYTHARIRSVIRKARELDYRPEYAEDFIPIAKEIELIKHLELFPEIVSVAASELNPSLIANYVYELAKEYNQFYHDYSILNAERVEQRNFRLLLSHVAADVIKSAMWLLGIEVPERM